MNKISEFFQSVRTFVTKSQPGSSVHVNSPLGSEDDEAYRIAKAAIDYDMNPPMDNLESTILNAAFGGKPGSATGDTPAAAAPAGADAGSPKKPSTPPAKGDKLKAEGPAKAKDGDPGGATPGKANLEKSGEVHPTQAPEGGRRVATIAVRHGDKILMGKRRDNGKWTMPGGHVEDGEDMHSGALRELHEETGMTNLKKRHLKPLAEIQKNTDKEGKPLHVQPFIVDAEKRHATTMKNDPDGEVHRWNWVDVSKGLPDEVANNLHVPPQYNCLLQALDLVPDEVKAQADSANAEEPIVKDGEDETIGDEGDNDETGLYSLQEIVSGMDYEIEVNKIDDENDAREVALENLEQDPEFYRKKWLEIDSANADATSIGKDTEETETSPLAGMGFNLDLGSGQAREPNHIGLDLYPYDYGTLIQDLNQGIPFPDESCESVRLVNALHHMDGLSDDPSALLEEIERVLMPGGEFHYEGPDELSGQPEFLEPTLHESTVEKANEGVPGWTKQSFKRIAKPDAATANDAEPRISVAQNEMLPADALLAMDAVGYYWADSTTSGKGNRAAGYPSQGALVQNNGKVGVGKTKGLYLNGRVPIMKMNSARQIVYGVVLSPDEADLQDDMMSAEEIEKTAHSYLERSRVVGSGHDKQVTAFPIESYIAPQDMEWEDGQYGPQKITKGAWVLGVKIVDPKEWKKVVSGDYTGFSVGGFGLRDPIT